MFSSSLFQLKASADASYSLPSFAVSLLSLLQEALFHRFRPLFSFSSGRFHDELIREMGGAPRNPEPFLVWIVKPSGCHCTDACGRGKKYRVECRHLLAAPPLWKTIYIYIYIYVSLKLSRRRLGMPRSASRGPGELGFSNGTLKRRYPRIMLSPPPEYETIFGT